MGFAEAVVYILLGLFVGFFCGLVTMFLFICDEFRMSAQERQDIIVICNDKNLAEVRKIITDLKYDKNSVNN